jgi:hypothetical protein
MDEETEAKKSQEISSNITKIMAEPRLEFWVYDSNIYPVDVLLLLLLLSSSLPPPPPLPLPLLPLPPFLLEGTQALCTLGKCSTT